MNSSNFATLLATLSIAVILTTSARADGFSSADTKHYHATASHTAIDYAKYQWVSDASVDRIVVSLADQRLYAYHDQQLVAWSNVSSGRPGHETPTGDFTVSEKDVDHHSSLYDDAYMPYFMRLTDGGVGLHGGFLPGYPASHGCVRLPYGMAQELFQHVQSGTNVEITGNSATPAVAQTEKDGTIKLAQN